MSDRDEDDDRRRRDDDDDDRPRRRRRRDDDDEGVKPEDAALGAVVPLGVSIWALLSLYTALFSCVIPGLGLLAILFGILAFTTQKQKSSYGSVTGNIRAIIGIVIGVITTVGSGFLLFAILTGA